MVSSDPFLWGVLYLGWVCSFSVPWCYFLSVLLLGSPVLNVSHKEPLICRLLMCTQLIGIISTEIVGKWEGTPQMLKIVLKRNALDCGKALRKPRGESNRTSSFTSLLFARRMSVHFEYTLGSTGLLATHLRIFFSRLGYSSQSSTIISFIQSKRRKLTLNFRISQSRQCWQDVIAASIERKGNASVVLKFFKKLACDLKLVILDKQFAPEW